MGRPKIEVPKNELRKLVNEGKRKPELAEYFGCSEGTIQNRAKEYGIKLNSGKRKIRIPEDELRELYFDKGLNTKEIGERYGCSQDPVQREMKRHGIEPNRKKVSMDRERVRGLYYEEEYSLADLSDELGHSEETLRSRMDEWGMERRSLYESYQTERYKQKISELTSGENNGMHGKSLSEEACEKISEANSGVSWEEKFDEETLKEQREHIKNLKHWEGEKRPEFSDKYSGEDHWHSGKEFSEEHKQKISKGTKQSYVNNPELRELRREHFADNAGPAYNPEACDIIEEFGEKHGYDFRHAENDGEKRVLNYFVDGYDSDKNVVVEYYEKHHKNDREYDRKRKREIIDELECKFIEIYEEGFTKVNWR